MQAKRTSTKQLLRMLSPFNKHLPGQLVVQYADACNATCPQCDIRVSSPFKRSRIKREDMTRIIDTAANNGVQALSFTGGEPFLYQNDVLEMVKYAVHAGIKYVRTGTNGFMFMNSENNGWERKMHQLGQDIADSGLYTFWISMDSAEPGRHEQLRSLPGVVKGLRKALPILQEYEVYPSVNLGISRNITVATSGQGITGNSDGEYQVFYEAFRKGFAKFYDLAIDLGFTIVNVCYPMSAAHDDTQGTTSLYGASSPVNSVTFTDKEKGCLLQALFDTLPDYRGRIRVFTPLSSLHTLIEHYRNGRTEGYPCRGGLDYFFIDAQKCGTYPCGFRGDENFGHYWKMDKPQTNGADCRKCDWECFRDPSEIFGPIMHFRSKPLGMLRQTFRERKKFKLWLDDIRYYNACDYFYARTEPNYDKLSKWVGKGIVVKDIGTRLASQIRSINPVVIHHAIKVKQNRQ